MRSLQKYTFLLALLVLVSPVFAEEHAAEETVPPIKKYVEFTLGGTYTDTKTVSTFGTSSTKTLRGLFKKLDILKDDDEIAGIIFKIESVSVGWATLQEFAINFMNSGKQKKKRLVTSKVVVTPNISSLLRWNALS